MTLRTLFISERIRVLGRYFIIGSGLAGSVVLLFLLSSDKGYSRGGAFANFAFFSDSAAVLGDSLTLPRPLSSDTVLFSESDSLRSAGLIPDSLRSRNDSLTALDTVKVEPRDSSARIEQFKYVRPDSLVSTVSQERVYPLFLKPPAIVQKEFKLDSTGRFVTIRETVGGKDIRIPIIMPLNEFISRRMKDALRNNFGETVYKLETIKMKTDLGELLGTFTNIDIPIPANPVFSIFGPPRINLHISGAVDIRAAFRNTTTDQVTTSLLGNSRNEPDFAQEVQINVSGTIGDKLNILADWNTQRTFEYENQLKIKYTGYEDEVVQEVEAGNVSLATSSSFISSSQALFGIKAGMQLGPLKLTAIASQKKGQVKELSVSGGSTEIPFEKRAYEYSKDHFFVDTSYISLFEPYYTDRMVTRPEKQITEYEVWVSHLGPITKTERSGVAYLNLPPLIDGNPYAYPFGRDTVNSKDGLIENNLWDRLEPKRDYVIHEFTGHITLNRTVQDGQSLAIAYRVEGEKKTYGILTKNQTAADSILMLKLIKPKNLLPQFTIPWRLQLKNIYSLGGRNIQKSGFDLQIKYALPGSEPVAEIGNVKIIRILGLDNVNDAGTPPPDNLFDYLSGFTIDEARGEIIFPMLKPFGEGMRTAFTRHSVAASADSFIYREVYDTTLQIAQQTSSRDRFIITGKTTAGSSNTYNLGFNIVENSVQVLLNGQPLTPNIDYTVDYIVGQVIIKNQAALIPGANLQIKFEQNDLFQLASKTLLGARGDMKLSENTSLGFTVMNLNQQTLNDKVRLNEEPINNTIFGIDGQTSSDLDFLTKAIDWLPLISTKAPSNISFRGEFAYMSPDPNTKKSPISFDDGMSIAYIDDFEGAKRTIPLGVGYGLWHDMSPPWYQPGVDPLPSDSSRSVTQAVKDTVKMKSKARVYWYNELPSTVTVSEIWGSKKTVARGQEQVPVLDIHYDPADRGAFNYSMDLQSTLLTAPKKNWGGMQRLLSSSTVDLVKENISFIEVWVKIREGSGSSFDSTRSQKIMIDLGAISEDVIPNRLLDTEDKNRNEILNEGEDTGLDGIPDDQERAEKAGFLAANAARFPQLGSDPAGDNWSYTMNQDYTRVNGTENNAASEIGRYPDTEDLNRNNVLDRSDSYYEYELDLNDPSLVVGIGGNGWKQLRIPIIKYSAKIGTPDFSLIEYVRLWMTGFDKTTEIRLTELNLVGNQWEELKKNDSTFSVSTINYEDNPNYPMPPGVIREQDRTRPDENILANEQSLNLVYKFLYAGDSSRQAIKRFTYKPLDVFNYREMRLYVHAVPNDSTLESRIFIRFGADTLNYYEYNAPVVNNPIADNWSSINIKFADLTSIKLEPGGAASRKRGAVPGDLNASYYVLGNPTLTRLTYIAIGIVNASPTKKPVSGEVWVNELRLIGVDDTPGWAYSFSTSVKFADIGSAAFTYSDVDPNFHSLEARFGSRSTSRSWNLSANISLERFLPSDWAGSSFPFSYSHSEGMSKPKYLPGSDILVSKAAEMQGERGDSINMASETMSITDTYAVPTIKINIPVEGWYINDIFNKMTYGFSYTSSFSRNPAVLFQKSWSWNGRWNYGYTAPPDWYAAPFTLFSNVFFLSEFKDFRLYFPITNISLALSASRSNTRQQSRGQPEAEPTRGLSASRQLSFGWKLTENGLLNLSGDYSVDIASTLVHLETYYNKAGVRVERPFTKILGELFMKDQFMNFGNDNAYTQTININTKPVLPNVFEINKFVTLAFRYGVSYRWSNNLQQTGDLGKGASWGNNITLSTDFSLKQFAETIFPAKIGSETTTEQTQSAEPRGRTRREDDEGAAAAPSPAGAAPAAAAPADSTKPVVKVPARKISIGESLTDIARLVIKTPLLDYDKINMTFSQTNSASNSGIQGRPGFANLFGRLPFFQSGIARFGPTQMYQLGLVSDPTSNVTDVHLQSKFPFIGFSVDQGLRAANASITDAYTQGNKLTLRTNRDLWTGARIDVNWNLGWDFSENKTLQTNALGEPSIISVSTGGSVERSFFTLPPTLIFSMFKSGIAEVGKKYSDMKNDKADLRSDDAKLAEAFETGFETLPVLRKVFGRYLPRLNYTFRWDGLEKFAFLDVIASKVGIEHAYSSSYKETYRGTVSGLNTESQRINYGFSPLLGMNITFKELFKGSFNANMRYGTTTAYDLTASSKNIVETFTREISVTASFARSGFEIPLFGLSLSNDIDISFSYTMSQNSRQTFATSETITDTGTPGEGSSRLVMEPRIRYVLSARVTASLYYRYTKIAPDEGGSRIPGSTSNEGGVDVHISIQ